MPTTPSMSFRLSARARALLLELAKRWGVSQKDVIELLLRERAKQEGITVDEEAPQK